METIRVLHYLGFQGMTGVEIFVKVLASAQKALGIDARLTFHPNGRNDLLELAKADNICVYPFIDAQIHHGVGVKRKFLRAILAFKRLKQVRDILEKQNIDVIHIHPVGIHCLPAFVGALWSRRNVKIIVTHHMTLAAYENYRTLRSHFIFWLECRYAQWVCVSYDKAAEEMIQAGVSADKVRTIPFCVDVTKFPFEKRTLNKMAPLNCVIMARMVEGKGHLELLQAFRELHAKGKKINLTIIGQGPLLNQVKHFIDAHNLSEIVSIVGQIDHNQLSLILRKMDVMVLPSYMIGETFPLSLLEAGAMGIPAIGTRWFGIPDIIEDKKTGLLIEPKDVGSLIQALDFLVEHREICFEMGLNAHQKATTLYSAKAIAGKYLDLYSKS